MADERDILELGRSDLRFVSLPGVYVLARRRAKGCSRVFAVGESQNIGAEFKQGTDDFRRACSEGVEEAIVIIERDSVARRRLTLAVAAALFNQARC